MHVYTSQALAVDHQRATPEERFHAVTATGYLQQRLVASITIVTLYSPYEDTDGICMGTR